MIKTGVNKMETEVKGHMSHRKGKRYYVRAHKLHYDWHATHRRLVRV